MVCKIKSVAINGIDVFPVTVETDISSGLPAFDMVGLLSSDTKEAKERVRTGIKNSGFTIPPKKITVNLSPGNIRKTGTYFDLPIAVSILYSLGIVNGSIEKTLFVGEISLNGDVVRIDGVLPMVLCAVEMGIDTCFVPMDNISECHFLKEIKVVGVRNLNQLVMFLNDGKFPICEEETNIKNNRNENPQYDFRNIKGQRETIRAAEIAAAGMHNMLMIGPPGTGKSMIAKTLPTILPDMTLEEQIEVSKIQSIAGNLSEGLMTRRPVRNPHHTVTVPAMVGGGQNPKPGEITLAHKGVLFMDELPEFSPKVIETLREPLEEGKVVVSRATGMYEFPAEFILLAAMNPCRCGYYPDRNKCNCSEREVSKYTGAISGPVLDRIDLCVRMNSVTVQEIRGEGEMADSETIKQRVMKAVDIQRMRYKGTGINFNSELQGREIQKYCKLDVRAEKLMEEVYEKMGLSVRAYEKILKVSRSIADLNNREKIEMSDIAEAVSFKVKNL